MTTVEELRTQAMQLPSQDRALLARDLLLSLEAEDFEDDSETAWMAEIEARSAAVASGNYTASEWHESIDRLRQDLRQRRQK